ncbi:mitochondrial FAD carrier protein [Lactarius hengduanensis]|nr:mitochondrial FAD carrier protein [Lactarius hengduanensis]
MNPLDFLKDKFQVSTLGPEGGIGGGIWRALCDIHANEGWRSYNQLKRRATVDTPDQPLMAPQYPLFSAESSSHSFLLVFSQTFLTLYQGGKSSDVLRATQHSRSALWAQECAVFARYSATRVEGGLYRGTLLPLAGAREHKRRCVAKFGRTWTTDDDKLSNTAYTIMSGSSKPGVLPIVARPTTVRRKSVVLRGAPRNGHPLVHIWRMQDSALAPTHHRTITSTIVHTWTHEGLAEFYRGLATNLVRVPLGTCVTFGVYENIVWLLKHAAARRKAHQDGDEGSR